MSKIFQILNGICYHELRGISLDDTKILYPPDVVFVEAPTNVFEGWGYADGEFIKPAPPEGWVYDESNGTFYPEDFDPAAPAPDYNAFLRGLMEGLDDE